MDIEKGVDTLWSHIYHDEDSKMAIKTLLEDYSSRASTHGVAYVFEKEGKPVTRIFWTVVIISSITIAGVYISKMYRSWDDNPIVTSIDNTAAPIDETQFPSVTICSSGNLKESVTEVLELYIKDTLVALDVPKDDIENITKLGVELFEYSDYILYVDRGDNVTEELNIPEAVLDHVLSGLKNEYDNLKSNDFDKRNIPLDLMKLMMTNDPVSKVNALAADLFSANNCHDSACPNNGTSLLSVRSDDQEECVKVVEANIECEAPYVHLRNVSTAILMQMLIYGKLFFTTVIIQ